MAITRPGDDGAVASRFGEDPTVATLHIHPTQVKVDAVAFVAGVDDLCASRIPSSEAMNCRVVVGQSADRMVEIGLIFVRFLDFNQIELLVFIATGIGQLPATIVYSWAGSLLTGGTFWFVTGLFILFALSVIISVARSLYLEHQRKKT